MGNFFLNGWMLAGLLAVLIPLIIEWLFKRKKRRVELPTLRYLLGNKEEKKVRRQDRILLIARMIAMGLLAMALARPMIKRGLFTEGGERNVVILLDGTASMNQQVGVATAFGWAQKKASSLVRELPKSAKVSVGYLGDKAMTVLDKSRDFHTAAAAIESLREGSGAAPMSAGLEWIAKLIENHDSPRSEVYIFSDFQKSTWAGTKADAVSEKMAVLSRNDEVTLIDSGGEETFNFQTTGLDPLERIVTCQMPTTFRASIASVGTVPEGVSASVTLLVNGEKKSIRKIERLQAPQTLDFEILFPEPGEYLVQTIVEGDKFSADNQRLYLAQVPGDYKVLVLDETPDQPFSDGAFIARAVSPPLLPGLSKVSRFSVKRIHPAALAYENLSQYWAVILTATDPLTEEGALLFERYVQDGGALWVVLGERVNLYQYNKWFFREGKGLLPARLKGIEGSAAAGKLQIAYTKSQHPALAYLFNAALNENALVSQHYALETGKNLEGDFKVLLKLSDGTPVIIEKLFGRGLVLEQAMTAGPAWTTFAALPEFAILTQEVLRYLIGDPNRDRNLKVGEKFCQPVFISAQHLLMKRPDGKRVRLTPKERPGIKDAWEIEYADTYCQGVYEIDAPPEVLPKRRFVVNSTTEEGDLSRLDKAQAANVLDGKWTWVERDESLEEIVMRRHSVTELSPILLWGLSALLALETFLAFRFGRRRGGATT